MLIYLNKMVEAFNNRIPWLFLLGTCIILCSILLGIITRLNKKAKIFFISGLIGVALICLSLTEKHNGLGLGDNSAEQVIQNDFKNDLTTFSTTKPTEITITDAEQLTERENLINIRVFGSQIYINNYLCKDYSELSGIISRLYKDSVSIRIIDDYAQDSVFDDVINVLGQNGILNYEVFESEKN